MTRIRHKERRLGTGPDFVPAAPAKYQAWELQQADGVPPAPLPWVQTAAPAASLQGHFLYILVPLPLLVDTSPIGC